MAWQMDPYGQPWNVPMTYQQAGHPPQPSYIGGAQQQELAQAQKLRSLQASEQMLYDVYENTMGSIEELEKHEEHGTLAGYSGLLGFPEGKKKEKHDATAIIEAELTCLDAQMTFAPPEVTKAARMKMLDRTLMWMAAREDKRIPPGLVDCYAKNVVQLIIKPESMKLPERKRDPRSAGLDPHKVNEVIFQYAKAKNQGEQQDRDFHENPDRKAAMRNMRQGGTEQSGITRLVKLDLNDKEFGQALIEAGKDVREYLR